MNDRDLDRQLDDDEDIYARRSWTDLGVAQAPSVQLGLLLLLVVLALFVLWIIWSLMTVG